jgi:diguanylate cyclase (GGDEF)-like protein
MLRTLIRRMGVPLATTALTVASMVASVIATAIVSLLLGNGLSGDGLVIALIVPAIVAPLFTYQILNLVARLDATEAKLRILATTDPLTEAFNRRHFEQLAEQEFARVHRYGGVFSVMIFDVDNFKSINDTYGHLAGDHVLSSLTAICQHESRVTDVFARYGGEEFIFLLPASDQPHALAFAERIRQVLAETSIKHSEYDLHLSVSIGVSTYRPGMSSLDSLLTEADAALYQAKRDGKNRISV